MCPTDFQPKTKVSLKTYCMHKEDFEVLWFNSKFMTPWYFSFQYHICRVYVVKVWSQCQKEHPSPCKQTLHNKGKKDMSCNSNKCYLHVCQ